MIALFLVACLLLGPTLNAAAVAARQPNMPYQRGQFWISRFRKQAEHLSAALAQLAAPPAAPTFVARALHMMQPGVLHAAATSPKQPEEGRLLKSRLPPVAQFAISRSQFLWGLRCDQTNDYVRPMAMVKFGREHHGGPNLCRGCAWKRTGYDIAWLQRPSRSSFSNRSRDASVASRRSSPDQESDHSIRPAAPEIRELLRPNQHLSGVVRRKHPHGLEERFFIGAKNHGRNVSFLR
jgi:hypothetical protein